MTDLQGWPTPDTGAAPAGLPTKSTVSVAEPGRWLFLVYLLLGGYLLFAHGCHGDEDNELFNWLSQGGPTAGKLSSPR